MLSTELPTPSVTVSDPSPSITQAGSSFDKRLLIASGMPFPTATRSPGITSLVIRSANSSKVSVFLSTIYRTYHLSMIAQAELIDSQKYQGL